MDQCTSHIDSGSGLAKTSGLMYLTIGVVGLIVTVIVVYGFYAGERIYRLDEPLVDAVLEIKLEAEASTL